MRKILPIVAFLVLAGCATGTSAIDQAISSIKSLCGFVTEDTQAIGALIGVADTTGTIAPYLAVADAVCGAVKQFAPKTAQAGTPLPITVTVHGIPVTGHF